MSILIGAHSVKKQTLTRIFKSFVLKNTLLFGCKILFIGKKKINIETDSSRCILAPKFPQFIVPASFCCYLPPQQKQLKTSLKTIFSNKIKSTILLRSRTNCITQYASALKAVKIIYLYFFTCRYTSMPFDNRGKG